MKISFEFFLCFLKFQNLLNSLKRVKRSPPVERKSQVGGFSSLNKTPCQNSKTFDTISQNQYSSQALESSPTHPAYHPPAQENYCHQLTASPETATRSSDVLEMNAPAVMSIESKTLPVLEPLPHEITPSAMIADDIIESSDSNQKPSSIYVADMTNISLTRSNKMTSSSIATPHSFCSMSG